MHTPPHRFGLFSLSLYAPLHGKEKHSAVDQPLVCHTLAQRSTNRSFAIPFLSGRPTARLHYPCSAVDQPLLDLVSRTLQKKFFGLETIQIQLIPVKPS